MTAQQMAEFGPKCCGTVNINSLQNIPAGPFTLIQYHPSAVPGRLMFLAFLLTSHSVTSPSPHKFSISDTYQTGAWDGDHRTQRRSLYPVSPERMNRSGTTKHTLPPRLPRAPRSGEKREGE